MTFRERHLALKDLLLGYFDQKFLGYIPKSEKETNKNYLKQKIHCIINDFRHLNDIYPIQQIFDILFLSPIGYCICIRKVFLEVMNCERFYKLDEGTLRYYFDMISEKWDAEDNFKVEQLIKLVTSKGHYNFYNDSGKLVVLLKNFCTKFISSNEFYRLLDNNKMFL